MMEVSVLMVVVMSLFMILSMSVNIVLVLYARNHLRAFVTASEEASHIFTLLDTYREHLESVYALPTFYGDDTLTSLLEHTKELHNFMSMYEGVYSLTHPDLLQQLTEATESLEREYEEKTAEG